MESPDYDSPWKDLLDAYFEPFMEFFFPAAYAQIDWTRGFEFLDKELQKITADAALGRRTVDKLVKVHLLTGAEVIALIHEAIEFHIEGIKEDGLAIPMPTSHSELIEIAA